MTTTFDLAKAPDNLPEAPRGAMVEIASTRAAQEVQAALVIAKRFPRDEAIAYARIMRSCQREPLAEAAMYSYPKGGSTITGPSIRLAEVLAQNWGNITFGIVEMEQRDGESDMQAFAWDLETNTRAVKVFTVKHTRHTRQGDYALTDPREIYEMTANQGARRMRACIMAIIPKDFQDAAVERCEKTLTEGGGGEPLADRVRKMVAAFAEHGVTAAMIEERLGHKLDATSAVELVDLRKVYQSLKDDMSNREQWFPVEAKKAAAAVKREEKAEPLKDQLGAAFDKTPAPADEAPAGPAPVPDTAPLKDQCIGILQGLTPEQQAAALDSFGIPPAMAEKIIRTLKAPTVKKLHAALVEAKG